MTLAEFDAVLDAHVSGLRNTWGQLCALIANQFRDSKGKAVVPSDFFPDPRQPREQARPQTLEEKIAMIETAMACGPISGKSSNSGSR